MDSRTVSIQPWQLLHNNSFSSRQSRVIIRMRITEGQFSRIFAMALRSFST